MFSCLNFSLTYKGIICRSVSCNKTKTNSDVELLYAEFSSYQNLSRMNYKGLSIMAS